MTQISRKSIRLGMAGFIADCHGSRLTIFPVILVNYTKKNTKLVFSTGSVGKPRTEKRENPDSFKTGYLHSKSPTLIQE